MSFLSSTTDDTYIITYYLNFFQLKFKLINCMGIGDWGLNELGFADFDFGFSVGEDTPSVVESAPNGVREYSESEFADEKFECECPRCGFKFNR